MAWAKSIAAGLVLGALISVLPFQLTALVTVPFIAVALLKREKAAQRRQFDRQILLNSVIVVTTCMLATQLPFKHLDGRVTLNSRCVPVADAAKAADWSTSELPESLLSQNV